MENKEQRRPFSVEVITVVTRAVRPVQNGAANVIEEPITGLALWDGADIRVKKK